MIYLLIWMYLIGMYLTYVAPLDSLDEDPELELQDYVVLLLWFIAIPLIFLYALFSHE